ncbi:MAG: hypothetical protein U1F44_07580 [Coriobacteriia bacterium]|nr:hypothetical protein [Coriobacteriia bacterium]
MTRNTECQREEGAATPGGIGTLVISTESAMDGSRTVIVELPIKMTKE